MSHDASTPLTRATQAILDTACLGQAMQGFDTLPSTNTTALAWARAGAAEGSVVVAEHQSAGRGRLGRPWNAASGQNLMFSLILRPSLPPESLGLLTMLAGVALVDTLRHYTSPLLPQIKWPNDILLEGRKCCGMLLESSLSGSQVEAVVLGIGLNVNQDLFPPPLNMTATSVLLATGRPAPRPALLADLLRHLEQHYQQLQQDEGAAIRRAYRTHLAGRGHLTTFRLAASGERLHGVLEDIDDAGALRLRTSDGLRTLHAGEVTTQ